MNKRSEQVDRKASEIDRMNKRSQQLDGKSAEVDRISELPDSLLIYILSLLDDMKDAVKTDLLSKRWKNLWTNLDTLVYNCDIENPSNEQAQQFLLFVDSTISRNTCPRIKKFSVTGSRFYEEAGYPDRVPNRDAPPIVDKWVDFILAKNVQDVKLGLQGLDYEIPVCFFCNSSFVTLEIDQVGKLNDDDMDDQFTLLVDLVQHYRDGQCFHYTKTFDVSWSMLKSLLLKRLYVKDEFMAEILLGCPVLEIMVMDTVRGMRNLNITTPSVNELKVLNFPYDIIDGNGDLHITAPWIKKLEVSGDFEYGICHLDSMPSLISASITPNCFTLEFNNCMSEDEYPDLWRDTINCLLQPVCGVTELVAGVELLRALSMSKLSDEESLTYNCKSIMLQSPICMHEVPGIVSLLESSPYLETLVIKVMPWQCDLCMHRNGDAFRDYTKYVKSVFSSFNDIDYLSEQKGKFVRIKNVKIDCTEKLYRGDDGYKRSKNMCFEHKVVAHIIKNAPVLEKLVISSSRSNGPDFARRYLQLMSSENEVGDKAAKWDLKKRKSSYEFCFSC